MSFINVVSALGDNNSIYPLIVRDCGIENLAKCTMTYKQNAKDSKLIAKEALRERIVDEYGTSAVWLGGIPFVEYIANKIIELKGYSSKIDLKLFKESTAQGLNINIEKFKTLAPEAVNDLKKAGKNRKIFQNLQIGKFFATTFIPIGIMGFLLPKLNFLYTKKKIDKLKNQKKSLISFEKNGVGEFAEKFKNKSQINFCGLEKMLYMSSLNKMMILDGGLTVGRVKTARNRKEKSEMIFKMAGMFYLNYFAPKKIEKYLNKLTKSLFGLNTSLDIKTLNDKSFIEELKSNKLVMPKEIDEKSILNFIDENPLSAFVSQLKKLKLVSFLENGVRDPRKFVDIDKIVLFKKSLEDFNIDALNSSSFEKYVKKALQAKSFSIVANILISSFLLAFALPKLQFLFRKLTTGSNLEPGIEGSMKNE